MPLFRSAVLRLVVFTLGLKAALYLLQYLSGWSELHSIAGAGLLVLGGVLGSGSGGGHLAEKAQVTALTGDDLRQYGKDRSRSFGSGVSLVLVGAVTLALALLLP